MKKIQAVSLLLLLLFAITLSAQDKPAGGGTVKLTGRLIEQDTKQPLEFATVTIQTPDNTTVNGAMTDVNGSFSLDLKPGIYNIKFDFISFKSIVISNKEITTDTNLGVTAMVPDATLLKEVEIVAERTTVDIKLDKKVYSIGKDMIVKGGTVSDVLDNVPSLAVDVEGNVSLRGNESVTILIDGRPSTLMGGNIADVLKLLPADSVDKVEVITNPSARYDAEGGGGIVNIILKKGKADGFNGSVIGSAGNPDTYGIMANVNYRQNKFNIFSNVGYNYRTSPGNSFTDAQYFNPDGSTREFINESRENDRKQNSFNGTLGFEWFINPTLTWTNSINARKSNGDNPTDTWYDHYFADGSFNKTRNRYNVEDEKDENFGISTNLIKKFNDKGHELKIDASVSTGLDDEKANISDITLDTPTPLIDNSFERTSNLEDEFRSLIQADYVWPINEKSRFEAGYRGSFNELTTDSYAEAIDNETGIWIPNENFIYELEYNEYVNALYTQYGSKFGDKFSYMLGLRWEDSNIDVNLLNLNQYNNKRYNNFFPSAFLSYEFSEESSASISYSRRINRPRGRFINPFSGLESNINIFMGNPDLDPSMTNSFDLGYLKRWKKLTLSTSAYFNATEDSFQFVRRTQTAEDGQTVVITSPINLAKEYRFGFEFNLNYTPYRWWRLNGNFNFFRNETDGDYTFTYTDPITGEVVNDYQNFDNSAYSWSARINSKINLPWGIDWQLNGSYNAPQETAQGRRVGVASANTALSKDFLKDKATVTLNASDIFNSRKMKNYTDIPNDIYSYSEMQWRQRQVTLSFTYRFNMSKQDRQKEQRQRQNGEGGDDEYMGG